MRLIASPKTWMDTDAVQQLRATTALPGMLQAVGHELAPDVLALAAVLDQPWADVILSEPPRPSSSAATWQPWISCSITHCKRLPHLAEPAEQ